MNRTSKGGDSSPLLIVVYFLPDFSNKAVIRAHIFGNAVLRKALSYTAVAIFAITFLATSVAVCICNSPRTLQNRRVLPDLLERHSFHIPATGSESNTRSHVSVWLHIHAIYSSSTELHLRSPVHESGNVLPFSRKWNHRVL